MKIYKSTELTNQQYHEEIEAISGSGLSVIYDQSPAHYKYAENEETAALVFGTAAHAMILEPEVFNATFCRGFDVSRYPDALIGDADLKKWLQVVGQKVSGNKAEKTSRILLLEPLQQIDTVLQQRHERWHGDKEQIKPDTYDKIQSMRKTIMKDDEIAEMLRGGFPEMSIVGELDGVQVKTRPDLITANGGLVNYKTTTDVHPERFGRKAYDYGYLLKASLEYDMFTLAYGKPPAFYVLLGQEKTSPFAFKPYYLSKQHLEIGRSQYRMALATYEHCLKNDNWPAYGAGVSELYLPEFIMNMHVS
jgi:hypothetical protein